MRKKTKIALCYQRIKSKKDTKPVFVKPMYEALKLMNAYQNHGSNCGSARPWRAAFWCVGWTETGNAKRGGARQSTFCF